MIITQARFEDIDSLLELHKKYHVSTVSEEDKPDGFITTDFTPEQLKGLIDEDGITIIKDGDNVLGYAMAASWQFWSEWPFFANMIKLLPDNSFEGTVLDMENSYQYGPITLDRSIRGTGMFEKLFNASLKNMSKRYPIMVTFINQINDRSYVAHTEKVPMEVISTFVFNNNDYYMLACPTK